MDNCPCSGYDRGIQLEDFFMTGPNEGHKADILATADTFIAAVPWGKWRTVLVFRREHGGRTYIRLRTWNRHRAKRVWYPTDRFFVIPVEDADNLAEAIRAAARGEAKRKMPAWYRARERADLERYEDLQDLDAPDEILTQAKRRMKRRRMAEK